jgi:Peptidase M10 serralysin C terminal
MNGSTAETVFVSGQYMDGGAGANIFKYLTVGNSLANYNADAIVNFDPVKDVVDLSSIDANTGLYSASPTANFTFIGTAPFSGSGGQVGYQYEAALNETLVEADVVGDSRPDLEIRLMGDINLTAANFALTAAQSAADLADGAAANVSSARYGAGTEYSYTNVLGESYSSFQELYTSGTTDVADNLNLSAGANQLDLYAYNLTISRGAGTESLTSGSIAFPLAYEPNEMIEAETVGSETFDFGSNFGNETIAGFATGANPDTIQFAASSFSYLTPNMTQAQDLAAVLSNASSGTAGTTITDSAGDSLTLAGVTSAMISANPAQFKFV